MTNGHITLRSTRGRLVVAATVLGSGVVFLEGSVVNVALPSIANELRLDMYGLQWILDGYLLTLSALILTGGSLGDVYGRARMFMLGSFCFGLTSALAAFMPDATSLIAVRLLQGAAGALLVPNSLAVLETVFDERDRAHAIAQWAGWSAASTALGPLAGGWIIDELSWRWVFGIVAPLAIIAAGLAARSTPTSQPWEACEHGRIDVVGAVLATVGLAGLTSALIVGPLRGFADALVLACAGGGLALLIAFVLYERRVACPMLPLSLFDSRAFVGTNAATLFIYAALSGVFFLLMVQLQTGLGYSALRAGASLLPINVLMLLLSPLASRLAGRFGASWLIAAGALLCAAGSLLFMRVVDGASYSRTVLPGAVVFGLGLATLVAPLTATMMAAASEELKGVASAFNNAVARVAGLLAVAAIPLAIGAAGGAHMEAIAAGFPTAMLICAGLSVAGALAAMLELSPKRSA